MACFENFSADSIVEASDMAEPLKSTRNIK